MTLYSSGAETVRSEADTCFRHNARHPRSEDTSSHAGKHQ